MSSGRGSQVGAGGEPADSHNPNAARDSAAGADPRSAAELELELAEVHCYTTGWRNG